MGGLVGGMVGLSVYWHVGCVAQSGAWFCSDVSRATPHTFCGDTYSLIEDCGRSRYERSVLPASASPLSCRRSH